MAFRNKVPIHQLPAFKVLVTQALVAIGLALAFLLKDLNAGFCALLGGSIALLPNIYFALKAFRYFGAQSVMATTLSLWSGEMGKYVLTAALFVLVFLAIKPIDLIALFISYFIVLIVSSLGLLLVKKSFKKY